VWFYWINRCSLVKAPNIPNKVMIDSRLCPWCTTHNEDLVSIAEQTSVGINAVVLAVVLFSCSLGIHLVHHVSHYLKMWCNPQNGKYIIYCNTVIGGLSHDHSKNTEKKLVMFGHVVSEIRKWHTDRQTGIVITMCDSLPLLSIEINN